MTPLPSARDSRLGLTLALVALGLVLLLCGLQAQRAHVDMTHGKEKVDFQVFWASAHVATTGGDLYRANETMGHFPYLYPPFLASVMRPFTFVGYRTGALVWNLGQLLLVIACCGLLWRLLGLLGAPEPAALAAGALLAAVDPLVDNLQWIQVNLAVLALVLGALIAVAKGRGAIFGVLVAVAAAIKVTPLGVFLLAPLLGRRQAAHALAGLGLGLAVCLVVVPGLLGGFGWALAMDRAALRQTFGDATEAGIRIRWGNNCANHSLFGALRWLFGSCGYKLGRLEPGTLASLFKLVVILVGAGTLLTSLFRGWPGQGDTGRDRWPLLAALVLLAVVLVSPIVWIHHWILVAPALALALAVALTAPAEARLLPGVAVLLLGLAFVGQGRLEGLFRGFVSVVHLAAWGVLMAACWQGRPAQNCAVSVEPSSARVEALPPDTISVTASK